MYLFRATYYYGLNLPLKFFKGMLLLGDNTFAASFVLVVSF